MSDTVTHPEAWQYVRAHRISTDDAATPPIEEEVGVALEATVTIDVADAGSYTVLCSPADKRAMVLGFLYSEGIIESMADVEVLRPCAVDPGIMRVRLADSAPRSADHGGDRLVLSSCGACGSENLDDRIEQLPGVADEFSIDVRLLPSVRNSLRENQLLFDACGGTHAAGIFNAAGEMLASAEDTGRHNALDKAIGKCLLAGQATAGCGVMLSGRVSLEMVGKCARAGIELVTAISAPTSLAIDVADRCNITLCAFVREVRATVFTHPRRALQGVK
jgi:FdhD protein